VAEEELLNEIAYLEDRVEGLGRRFFGEDPKRSWNDSLNPSRRSFPVFAAHSAKVAIFPDLLQ
jgi:hypothetical protein